MKSDFDFGRMAEQLSMMFTVALWLGQTAVESPQVATLACVLFLALSKAVSLIKG
jgi:hypothetical protein